MKQVLLMVLVLSLAGCGGVHKARKDAKRGAPKPVAVSTPSNPVSSGQAGVAAAPVAMPFARGPLNKACMSSERKARSRALCGCIQAAADRTLSSSQQRVAVSFYSDPHKAQEIRQSDKPSHERFWDDYKEYGETAQRMCR